MRCSRRRVVDGCRDPLLALGLVCVVTGPLAWRWFWLRSAD